MRFEDNPNFSVVGKSPEEDKEIVRREMREALYQKERHFGRLESDLEMDISEHELEKTEETKEFIRMADEETNRLLEKFSIKTYSFPEKNVHVFPDRIYEEKVDEKNEAEARNHSQSILLKEERLKYGRLGSALTIFHEMLHMKSRLVYHANTKERNGDQVIRTSLYRNGVEVRSVPDREKGIGSHSHFYGLNEAIVAHEEKRYFHKLLEDQRFFKEKSDLFSEEALDNKNQIFEEKGIFQDEIFHIDPEAERFQSIGYKNERAVLEYVCKTVARDTGISVDEVHDEFLKSQLTGRLLPIARIVEESFGKGSFRELGNMDENRETALKVLENLKKMRSSKEVLQEERRNVFQEGHHGSRENISALPAKKEKRGILSSLKRGLGNFFGFFNPRRWFRR